MSSQVKRTSALVNGAPSDQRTPPRSRYRTAMPPAPSSTTPPFSTVGTDSLSAGTNAPSGSTPSRPSSVIADTSALVCAPVVYSGLSVPGSCQPTTSVPPSRPASLDAVGAGAPQAVTITTRTASARTR